MIHGKIQIVCSFAEYLVPLYVALHPDDAPAAQYFIGKVQRHEVPLPPGFRIAGDRVFWNKRSSFNAP